MDFLVHFSYLAIPRVPIYLMALLTSKFFFSLPNFNVIFCFCNNVPLCIIPVKKKILSYKLNQ